MSRNEAPPIYAGRTGVSTQSLVETDSGSRAGRSSCAPAQPGKIGGVVVCPPIGVHGGGHLPPARDRSEKRLEVEPEARPGQPRQLARALVEIQDRAVRAPALQLDEACGDL